MTSTIIGIILMVWGVIWLLRLFAVARSRTHSFHEIEHLKLKISLVAVLPLVVGLILVLA